MATRYNPAQYIPDFSWIGDIGAEIGNAVKGIGEVAKANKQLLANQASNEDLYNMTRQNIDKLGFDIDETLYKPKANESNAEYLKRLTVVLKQSADVHQAAAPQRAAERQTQLGEEVSRLTSPQPGTSAIPDQPIKLGGADATLFGAEQGPEQPPIAGSSAELGTGLRQAGFGEEEIKGPVGEAQKLETLGLRHEKEAAIQQRHDERIALMKKNDAERKATQRANLQRLKNTAVYNNAESNMKWMWKEMDDVRREIQEIERDKAKLEAKAADVTDLADYSSSIKTLDTQLEEATKRQEAFGKIGDEISTYGGSWNMTQIQQRLQQMIQALTKPESLLAQPKTQAAPDADAKALELLKAENPGMSDDEIRQLPLYNQVIQKLNAL